MKFGKVAELDKVNFDFPTEPQQNTSVLKATQIDGQALQIYLGCPTWGNKDWVGKIYPLKTPAKDFLKHYAQSYNTVEVSSTHYSLPAKETITKWRNSVGPDFRFCPKFHQVITHRKHLKDCHDWLERFYETIAGFEDNLGMSFLQLPPSFDAYKYRLLEEFLASKPDDLELAVELRHPQWFATEKAKDYLFKLLEEHQTTAVITDTAGRRDVLHQRLTSTTAFVRFVGNDLHPTDYKRIDQWIELIARWIEQGLQKLYFFIHEPDELHCPEMTKYFVEQIKKTAAIELKPIQFIQQNTQGTLF